MSRLPYEFATIRYVHDPVLEEALNVGVAMFVPIRGEFLIQMDESFQRLSQAFPGFDGATYRRSVHELQSLADAIAKETQRELKAEGDLFDQPGIKSFIDATSRALPDAELSLRIGRISAGLTDDPSQEINSLFQRFVKASQAIQKDLRREDEEIWHGFRRTLEPKVVANLHPQTVQTREVDIKFEHTFVNQDLQAIQPLSFDYLKADSISDKAARWVGLGVALEAARAVRKLYLLLGKPVRSENKRAYDRAKNLLDKMPLDHEIVEESEAESFARVLVSVMREHGIIDNDR